MDRLDEILAAIAVDVRTLLASRAVPLAKADPPETSGVYVLSVGEEVTYVGEAKGSKGLRDRLLRKHISGDDGHAIQRAYLTDFPDRLKRRRHILEHVHARWLVISDPDRVSAVERVLLCLYRPAWNKK
jgi:hypothetical protein